MTTSQPPKVFICHGSEDKDRFVLEFAKRLRENGVDAWLDAWEILPGDRLVDKIFNGMRDASTVVVVLSAASVDKPWVREELNTAFVRRLSSAKVRIIPVILEECDVPECLLTTVWQWIKDVHRYPDEFQAILNAIFGHVAKPPIGAPPIHAAASPLLSSPSLEKVDLLVFEALCEESVRVNDALVTELTCLDAVVAMGFTDDEIRDSLRSLSDEGYLDLSMVMGRSYRNTHISHLRIHVGAFDAFARAKWPDYDATLTRLIAGLVNEGWQHKTDVDRIDAPARLRDHLVRLLEDEGLIQVSRPHGGYFVWVVSPRLKRQLAND